MTRDPIVEDVRRQREKIAAQFKFDVRAIARDARRRERQGNRRVVFYDGALLAGKS